MSHFAKLDENNVVISVTVGRQEDDGREAQLSERTGDVYRQTSYNTRGGVYYTLNKAGQPVASDDQTKAFRFNFAGVGFTFDSSKGTDGAFIPPQPFDSWVLDEGTCLWVAPVALPDDADTVAYVWDEEAGDWVAVAEDEVE